MAPTHSRYVAAVLWIVMLFVAAWWITVLGEVVRTPGWMWRQADLNQTMYLLLVILLGPLGALLFVLVGRPALRATAV